MFRYFRTKSQVLVVVISFIAAAATLATIALPRDVKSRGTASLTTSSLPPKAHRLESLDPGDRAFKPSHAMIVQVAENSPRSDDSSPTGSVKGSPLMAFNCGTSIDISSSPSTARVFDPVTFTANVDESVNCHGQQIGYCYGTVVFYDGEAQFGTASIGESCQGTLTYSNLGARTHHIRGVFEPYDNGWHESSAHLTEIITKYPTLTTLTSSPNPSSDGQEVIFMATVTTDEGDVPTRQVRFLNGTMPIGTVNLDGNGVATLHSKKLPVGTNSITAEYLSDNTYAPSTSAVLNQVVNP
jgi:hypothetical protein